VTAKLASAFAGTGVYHGQRSGSSRLGVSRTEPIHFHSSSSSVIKMDLLEIGVNVVTWTGLAHDRYRWRALVNSVMNLRVP
jgi:hypothetical protein